MKHFKKLPTAKKIVVWLFINCTVIELFTGYATIASIQLARETFQPVDFSPLVTLIGAVIAEVIGYAVYAAKAALENKQGGITYDLAMRNSPAPDPEEEIKEEPKG